METDGTPNILLEALQDFEPAPDSLADIWRRMPEETLAPEQERIRQNFLYMAGKLATINAVRGKQ